MIFLIISYVFMMMVMLVTMMLLLMMTMMVVVVGLILLHLNASLGRCGGGESNSIGGNSDKLNNSTGVHQLP